jgi:hypothetical protein
MKKIKNSLINIALIICFFSFAGRATGQTKGVDCDNVHWKIVRDLNFECRYNVHVNVTYGSITNSTGLQLPHGIYINVIGGSIAGIGTLQSYPAGWFNDPTQPIPVPQTIFPNPHEIFWIKQMNCGGSNWADAVTKKNMIKDNETLIIPLDITPDAGPPAIEIIGWLIEGQAWPYCLPITNIPVACNLCTTPNSPPPVPTVSSIIPDLDCIVDTIFPHDTTQYQIICNHAENYLPLSAPFDCILCLPQFQCANLTLSPQPLPYSPPFPTKIVWFQRTTGPFPCTSVTLNDLPQPYGSSTVSLWHKVLEQTYTPGGQEPFYPTGQRDTTSCYVAIMTSGCDSWITDPITLWVCKPLPGINITATPALTWIDQGWHACEHWSGTLSIPPTWITCETNIVWERFDFLTTTWIVKQNLNYPSTNPSQDPSLTYTVLPSPPDLLVSNNPLTSNCDSLYRFRVTLSNACSPPVSTNFIDIHIDKRTEDCQYTFAADPVWIGNLPGTSILNPIFCDSGATVIKFSGKCLKIYRWEISELTDPCGTTWTPWATLGQAGTSPTWWTNTLNKSTKYRVWIYNVSCFDINNPVYSSELLVTIIPKPKLTLTTDRYYLCPPCSPPTLTAAISCAGTNPLNYQWAVNGTIVAMTSGNTFQPGNAGAWSVIVVGVCGQVQSNNITICGPPVLAISGPCGFCNGESFTLQAVVQGCNIQTIAYEWKDGSGNTISTNSSVTLSAADTYSLTAIIDNCCVLTATKTVDLCPSTYH